MEKRVSRVENYVVRSAIVTASVSLSTGTPTTLLAGDTDYLLDLVQIYFANNSGAATTVTLMDDGTSLHTFNIPVVTVEGVLYDFTVPWPQSTKGGRWYLDMPDITGTTIDVKALFIKREK